MKNVVRKGMRLLKPRRIGSLELRPELYEWLSDISREQECGLSVLVRGILEDFYDRYHVTAPSEEVSE